MEKKREAEQSRPENSDETEKTSPSGAVPPAPKKKAKSTNFVNLAFKVEPDFRWRFKRTAVNARLSNVELLRRALAAYQRDHPKTKRGEAEEQTGADRTTNPPADTPEGRSPDTATERGKKPRSG